MAAAMAWGALAAAPLHARAQSAAASATPSSSAAPSATGPLAGWPCPGCVVRPPARSPHPRWPLLVVLHGDEGTTRRMLEIWSAPAADAGFLLFAPACPKSEGCAGSFWRWRGDPAWLLRQVDALEARYPIDVAREYLAGWSGGASYLGLFGARWSPRFAALSLAGGGLPPSDASACAPCRAPVAYLMGDRNPYFGLAESTRDYFRACGHEVAWDLLPGASHAAELTAYAAPARAKAILAWLTAHPNACAASDAGAPIAAPADAADDPVAEPDDRALGATDGGERPSGAAPAPGAPAAATPTVPIAPAGRCVCDHLGAPDGAAGTLKAAGAALLALAFARGRARRLARRCSDECPTPLQIGGARRRARPRAPPPPRPRAPPPAAAASRPRGATQGVSYKNSTAAKYFPTPLLRVGARGRAARAAAASASASAPSEAADVARPRGTSQEQPPSSLVSSPPPAAGAPPARPPWIDFT